MHDLKHQVEELSQRLELIKNSFSLEEKKDSIKSLEAKTTDPDLWNDQEKARNLMMQLSESKEEVRELESLLSEVNTLQEISATMGSADEFKREISDLTKRLEKFELKSFLSGRYDQKNAMVSIHAGQGGTEAMDWVSMLFRMYFRFCERRNWKCETIDLSEGEEAGIKSITFKVSGNYAYGYLKGEAGTHRLVRQSPFNADKLRETSFALVEVLPELEEMDLPDIVIKDEDLDWQFFRASSQGGQNVQKVSTAVRLKHKPSGLIVTAQTERFQEQNRKIALTLLRAKLWVLEEARKASEEKQIKGEYKPASWGNQIRSYVLHPYRMVKDLRTQVETGDTEAVLDGYIDEFIDAELKKSVN